LVPQGPQPLYALPLDPCAKLSCAWANQQGRAPYRGPHGTVGVSFERAIYYHKSLMLAIMVIHILQRGTNTSEIVLIITLLIIATVYLGKNLNFEFFYYLHIAAYIATAIVLIFLSSAHAL
jgi:hypothetical protein